MEGDTVNDDVIGVSARRASELLGLSLHKIAAWEGSGLVRPDLSVRHGRRALRVYTLGELLELAVVRELVGHGIGVDRVRRLVEDYRRIADRPLRELRWAVDGRRVYVHDGKGWMGGGNPRQGVMRGTIPLERLRVDLRRRAVERDPALRGQIERRDRVLRRRPVFAGTRTPVDAVREYLDRGYSDGDILEAYPHLVVEDIDAARQATPAAS